MSIVALPAILVSPPIFTFLVTPKPPVVDIAPLLIAVESVLEELLISPVNDAPDKFAFNASAVWARVTSAAKLLDASVINVVFATSAA